MYPDITLVQKFLILWNEDPAVQTAKIVVALLTVTILIFALFGRQIFGEPYEDHATMNDSFQVVGMPPQQEHSRALRVNKESSNMPAWAKTGLVIAPYVIFFACLLITANTLEFTRTADGVIRYAEKEFHGDSLEFLTRTWNVIEVLTFVLLAWWALSRD